MLDFTFHIPTRIIFGTGCLVQLATTRFLPAGDRAMIVIGESGAMLAGGYYDRVHGLLSSQGVGTIMFDEVTPNPESDQVDKAAAICREKGVEYLVALGGGSTIDAAKAIAMVAANGGTCWEYAPGGTGGKRQPQHPSLPVVAIPTTAGTGTEADPWFVISKSGGREKIGWGYHHTFPALSLVDPELTLSAPPRLTAHTGMDAFFHAVESYLNTNRQPMNDLLALEAAHLIAHALPAAVADPDNLELRTLLSWASTAAGMCESLSGCISHHSLEHALSAFAPELPHGSGLVRLSVPYFTRLGQLAPERFGDLAMAMDDSLSEEEAAERGPELFVAGLAALIDAIGLGGEDLKDYGLTIEDAPQLAQNALETMGALFDVTPGNMAMDDLTAIFEQAIG